MPASPTTITDPPIPQMHTYLHPVFITIAPTDGACRILALRSLRQMQAKRAASSSMRLSAALLLGRTPASCVRSHAKSARCCVCRR